MFAEKLELFGERIAIIPDDGPSISYAELAKKADSLFSQENAPMGARHVVAIECDNSLDSVLCYLGALRKGFPALLVDSQLSGELRNKLYSRFEVPLRRTTEGQWVETGFGEPFPEVHTDLALLMSTSGSTGEPKLVKLSKSNLQANAESIVEYLDIGVSDRPITTLPMHYSYGLSVINSHLLSGSTVLLTNQSIASAGFWNFFRNHAATSFAGVPATYSILRRMRFERMDLPSLKTMTQAGGAMPIDDAKWFADLCAAKGRRLFLMYGQTEATARMAYVPFERLSEKIGSVGVAIPGGRLFIRSETGEEAVAPRTQGELVYCGPNVMMGYAESANDLGVAGNLGNTLATGDLGWQDEDGYFYINGRIKRFIKVFGNRIGLDECERDLRQLGWDVAVTGRDDMLMVAVKPSAVDLKDLTKQISHRYQIHPSAIRVLSVESFPMNSSGKILYQELNRIMLTSGEKS